MPAKETKEVIFELPVKQEEFEHDSSMLSAPGAQYSNHTDQSQIVKSEVDEVEEMVLNNDAESRKTIRDLNYVSLKFVSQQQPPRIPLPYRPVPIFAISSYDRVLILTSRSGTESHSTF